MPPFNFTNKAQEALRRAHEIAIERGQNHVDVIHLLASLIMQEDGIIVSILDKLEVDHVFLSD
ncbi:Clp protease N-terminal domain-containing protein, partial [Patescibacteria group bacterium]|nr:Clp protease N-terminal domain-containing protein [Patescibacteria group bacterium]